MCVGSRCLLACAALVCGCSGAVHTLDTDLAFMKELLEQGRYADVYEALSSQQKKSIEMQQFVDALESDEAAVAGLMEMLDEAMENPDVQYRARITLEDGSEVVLLMVQGQWIIETPITSFYGQGSPREALISFIHAFHASRWDVLATLVPSGAGTEDDAAMLEQLWSDPDTSQHIERLVMVLESHVQDEIAIQGNRATLVYPEGQVTFLRESGKWVILDLE